MGVDRPSAIGRTVTPAGRISVTVAGLATAVVARVLFGGVYAASSFPAAIFFATILTVVALTMGWRPSLPASRAMVMGTIGGLVLIAGPIFSHTNMASLLHPTSWTIFLPWSLTTLSVVIGEEVVIRGLLYRTIVAATGEMQAIGFTAVTFAVIHVPLYGWRAFPLDCAAGLWLSVLRATTGSVTAPAVAHVVADLSTWWLG